MLKSENDVSTWIGICLLMSENCNFKLVIIKNAKVQFLCSFLCSFYAYAHK